jgi:hypothetical protein
VFTTWFDTSSSSGWNPLVTISDDDSFHPAAETFPYHHPEVDQTCSQSTTSACETLHISNTEHAYPSWNDDKIEIAPLSAYEIRTKLKSNQYIQQKAGVTDADFTLLDL